MLNGHPRLRGSFFVSRRGAEEAEIAEGFRFGNLFFSAASALFAPLRVTFSSLRAGAFA
jgi:hypothetical protein